MRTLAFIISLLLYTSKTFAQGIPSRQLSLEDKVISLNNIRFELNADGLPKQSNIENDGRNDQPQHLLYEPMHFHFYTSAKAQEKMTVLNLDVVSQNRDSIVWKATSTSANLKMNVYGKMLSSGLIKYRISLLPTNNIHLAAVNFHIPFEKSVARYLKGLGQDSYMRPDTVRWNQASWENIEPTVWIGNDSLGLYLGIKESSKWLKNNGGSIQINVKGSSMLADVYASNITLNQGDILDFDFNLIVTAQTSKGQYSIAKRFKKYKKLDKKASNKN
ncbi:MULTISPECIES: glycoside hydrolase domain-containing protein [unclassified Pedobacter]|uniref:glycoside hydrolase domain-containing protein n=1 Tax=unclassified Pedobacter TaxID=2628915 RepID=UPI001E637A21|nr:MULTISPECIES: glycoside hydrolase domain-containing protein [unclassified Pedobacter]